MTTRVPASMQGLSPTGGDDTALIQAALNAGNPVVDLGSGTYRIDGTLTVPPGVTLAGSSAASEYYPGAPGSRAANLPTISVSVRTSASKVSMAPLLSKPAAPTTHSTNASALIGRASLRHSWRRLNFS